MLSQDVLRPLIVILTVILVPTLLGLWAGHALHLGELRGFWLGLALASGWFVLGLIFEPRLRGQLD